MKLLLLTAIIAAVTSSPVVESKWPWQVGKVYRYDASTYTWSEFETASKGNVFKAQFVITVKAPGLLVAKVENPSYAIHYIKLENNGELPSDLQFTPVANLDQAFEILVDGGRVVSLNLPESLTIAHENILKGLVSALQVDLSTYGYVKDYSNNYDKATFQGLFKKNEADVTGNCETLYSVSPLSAEWRRELPEFSSEEDPIEIVKSKNYGSCKKRIDFEFGVPEGAVWKGLAYDNDKQQFIKNSYEARLVASKTGKIYKSDVFSSVYVNPFFNGKQKAQVYSYVKLYLKTVEQDNSVEWQKPKDFRTSHSLLYTADKSVSYFTNGDEKNIAKIQKILQEISPLLQDPSSMTKKQFLLKFSLLVFMVRSLNSQQLAQLTSSIDIAKDSKNVAKNAMWYVYRDAVAQAGTTEAFGEIKSWVLSKKIELEEAGEVISGIGASMYDPTPVDVAEFYKFATTPEVLEMRIVNNSALLAASKLCRTAAKDDFVVNTVIPRFAKDLKQAIENGESSKAQVYVRVLTNLANPTVLKVFVPYLDGSVPVTKYLRIQMVTNLKTLALMKNKEVQTVSYSILKNTAEPYEVRVAAALNLFMSFPTAEMMQVLAHMTNDDPSTQVRAVLYNGIIYAAKLKDPRFAELAKTAKSVLYIVTKEKYGYRYSTDSLMDGYSDEDGFSFFRELGYIGSGDSAMPKYERVALRFKGTGLYNENQFVWSFSDVKDVIMFVLKQMYEAPKTEADFKFTAKQVIEALNLKYAKREPLEGALLIENLNHQKLITFDEEEFAQFIQGIVIGMKDTVESGYEAQYTKMHFKQYTSVAFPLASGMPFLFEYNEPVLFNIMFKGKLQLDKTKPNAGSFESKLDFTYARKLQGFAGFFDILSYTSFCTGISSDLQIYLPLKFSTEFSSTADIKFKFEAIDVENDVNLISFNIRPYLLTHHKNSATFDPHYLIRHTKRKYTDVKFGTLTGMSYQLKGYSSSSDYKNLEDLFEAHILDKIGGLLYPKDLAFTEYTFKFLAGKSKVKSVDLTLNVGLFYNLKNTGNMGPATLPKNTEVNSEERRKEMAKQVSSSMEGSEIHVVDIGLEFNGPTKVDYVFTSALAYSFVDPKVQFSWYARGSEQYSGVFQINTQNTKIVPLNFLDALANKIDVTYEADLKLPNDFNIHMDGYGKRSEQYTKMLKYDPLARTCLEDIHKDNFFQKHCYKLIMKAHTPDYFKANITYSKIDPSYYNLFALGYQAFKSQYVWEEETNVLETVKDGNVIFEAQAYYYDNYFDCKLTSKYGTLNLDKAEGVWHYPYSFAIYTPINNWDRSYNYYTGGQNMPYCAVDGNKVWTFSGRSYDYTLSSSWHVVMVDEASDNTQFADVVILARRPSANQEEVYVSYKAANGKYIELFIKPNNVEVKSNLEKVTDGALTMYWDEDVKLPFLEYFNLSEGIQVFNLDSRSIRMVYDQHRLIIYTGNHRSTTRGICGQSSSQISDDYMTPFGLVDSPQLYGASFSLDGEFSDPKTVELKAEAKLKAYQPVTKYTKIFYSESNKASWAKSFMHSTRM